MQNTDYEAFMKTFNRVVDDVCQDVDLLDVKGGIADELKSHVRRVMEYNVPNGKLTRGLTVVHCAEALAVDVTTVAADAAILGWCVEVMQALFLMADDIMDSSQTRRGKLCWYKVEGVGFPVAVNDSLLLYTILLRLFEKYFKDARYYSEMISLVLSVTFRTVLGQHLDTNIQPKKEQLDLSQYTMERYDAIVVHKTAFYSFYFPLALGMMVAKFSQSEFLQQTKDFCLTLGKYFQIQDDYLDCYGPSEVTGKVGTDIEEQKCSWLCCQFLLHCNEEDRSEFATAYGKKETACVNKVKELYAKYNMKLIYERYEAEAVGDLKALIAQVEHEKLRSTLERMVHVIYKRNK